MFFRRLFEKKNKKVVIVQCRLSSTRLPRKALLNLGGKTVLEWCLSAMKKISADKYYLATDLESQAELAPYAKKCGFKIYAGSKNDVLKRFCDVINLTEADIVLRATADNPFLFYEAAQKLLDDFIEKNKISKIDYLTYKNLPHGSGVEVFNAHSLLEAAELTNSEYDHEHVGPALYNHTDKFNCLFINPEKKFINSKLRTTIDTSFDYKKAIAIVDIISGGSKIKEPYTYSQILSAFEVDYIKYLTLLIPSVKKNQGTGHLRRCLDIAIKNHFDIYIPQDASLEQCSDLVFEAKNEGLKDWQIIDTLDFVDQYNLIITDLFKTDDETKNKIVNKAAVISLDEGCENTNYVDYLLDIIPSTQLIRKANLVNHSFIPVPENVRSDIKSDIENSLVVFGGEDPENLTLKTMIALARNNIYVKGIFSTQIEIEKAKESVKGEDFLPYMSFSLPVQNLKESLYEYDLVVSHFGFTAFEASAAKCKVLLVALSSLHEKLSNDNNFYCIKKEDCNEKYFSRLLQKSEDLISKPIQNGKQSIYDFTKELSKGKNLSCPVCMKKSVIDDLVVARTTKRTFRRCSSCGLVYMSWSLREKETEYNHSYFFEDYEKQYGKTYLEDFNAIKIQGLRRIGIIDMLYRKNHSSVTPSILDIGCAMGPFLSASSDSGWQVFGTDISKDAVEYVQNVLSYPAICADFPTEKLTDEFGIEQYDCVTMWFVIEHFKNLDIVLKEVSNLVKKGGIFLLVLHLHLELVQNIIIKIFMKIPLQIIIRFGSQNVVRQF